MGRDGDQTDRYRRILDAAAKHFHERGYAATSLKLIADDAGLTAPALYWHFDSKADLLYHFLLDTAETSLELIGERLADATDPIERLRRLVRAHVDVQFLRLHSAQAFGGLTFSWQQLAKELGDERAARLADLQRRHVDQCREILHAGIAAGRFEVADVTTTAFAILNMCERISGWYDPEGPRTPDELAELHVDLALKMVAPGPDAGSPPTAAE